MHRAGCPRSATPAASAGGRDYVVRALLHGLPGPIVVEGKSCITTGTVFDNYDGRQVDFGVVNAGDAVQYTDSSVTDTTMSGSYGATTGLRTGDSVTFAISK